MIFKKLSVQHFKRLKNATFDFKPGINIIKGENETGKSTMKLAFLTALFSSPRSDATARDIKTWGTDFKSRITLQFETDSSGYALAKDFQEKEAVLVDGKSKRKYEDPASVQKVLSEILGIGTQSLFESTAYIDHTMVTDINKGRKEIRESLGASLTGAGEDTSAEKITKKLDKIISDMEKGLIRPTTNPGILRALKDEIKKHEEELGEIRSRSSELEKGASTYEKVVSDLLKAESDYVTKKDLFESNKKYYELKESEEKLKKQYSELEHRVEGIKEDQKKLGAIDEKLKDLGVEQKKVPNWILFAGLGAAVVILSVILALLNIWLIVASMISIPFFVYSAVLYKIKQEIIKKGAKASELLNQRKVIEASIEGKRGKKSVSDIEREWSDVRRKLKDAEDELSKPEVKAVQITPQEFQKLTKEIKALESKRDELRMRKAKGEAYLEQRKISESEIADIEEELEAKEEDLKRESKKAEVYKLTMDTIKEAFTQTISPARDVLKEKVAEYFEIITGGRYNKIELEEGTLEFKVYSPEKKDWVSVIPKDEELSRGTIDQFFLAARLALVDVVSGGKKPPIFLDDPFVTFDEKRLKRAMELLKEISKNHQIFIFTCKDTYDDFAQNTVKVSL